MKGLGFVIFILFIIVSNILNTIKESKARKEAEARRAQLSTQRRAQQSGSGSEGRSENPRPETPASRRVEPQRAQKTPRNKQNRKSGAQAAAERPEQESRRNDRRAGIGSGVAEHVDTFIGQHVQSHMGRHVDRHVERDISDRVKRNLGETSNPPAETPAPGKAGEILALLKSPSGVRQAMIVNEILSKPRSLRRRETP